MPTEFVFQFPPGTLAGREFFAGDLAMLTNGDPAVYEVVYITNVYTSAEQDRIDIGEVPKIPWPKGTRIIPLRKAHFEDLPSRNALTSEVSTMTARFELDDTERNIEPSWGDERIFKFKTNWVNAVDFGYERTTYTMDTQTGVVEILDPADVGRITRRGLISLFGRSTVNAFRSFLAQARGRAVKFWCNTGTHDLEPLGVIGGASRLDVVPVGYSSLMNVPQDARRAIAIYFKDESEPFYASIQFIESRGAFDRLLLSAEPPAVDRSAIDRVSFLMPVRFDQDSFEIEHFTDQLAAVRSSVVVRSVEMGDMGLLDTPIPLLLDTFTAPDGTDPTSRDIDIYPTDDVSLRRWRAWRADETEGVIQSNALERNPPYPARLFINNDLETNFIILSSTTLFIEVIVTENADIRFAVYDETGNNEIRLEVVGNYDNTNTIVGTVYAFNGDYQDSNISTILDRDDTETVRVSLHTSGGVVSLICNGEIKDSYSGIDTWLDHSWAIVDLRNWGEAPGTRVNLAAIYDGITLEQAIALTT